ncbi:chaperone TorD involved in molybdoenzyme TorA maturation [Ferrimonas sediminum]|uniref:Chaperone TorD involved in molybdoenzyme TorA maturation n=1 Tax=Ferrimonas sediminum TaxID=718193 RepID=A0A1G8QBS3_9GAMM|nr:molecular chaperone TorD family protein [Ferrimonas sediminum]SDJ02244.1 chaperone TorD involved in molybdoenzyme TorA maturation [Ferrimonas sediminum]
MSCDTEMALTAASLRVLHNLFYHKPSKERLAELRDSGLLSAWPGRGTDDDVERGLLQMERSLTGDRLEQIERDFYALFIGPGPALASPYGSVYLDRDNLVCGEGTRRFQQLCQAQGVTMTLHSQGPWDHFGLMLASLALLLEQDRQVAAAELLGDHLWPWAPRFLERVVEHGRCGLFQGAAQLAQWHLGLLLRQLAVTPRECPLYH